MARRAKQLVTGVAGILRATGLVVETAVIFGSIAQSVVSHEQCLVEVLRKK